MYIELNSKLYSLQAASKEYWTLIGCTRDSSSSGSTRRRYRKTGAPSIKISKTVQEGLQILLSWILHKFSWDYC